MSVILDALKKAQDERKGSAYHSGGDEGAPGRSRWLFYVIAGVVVCVILVVLFLPNLHRMQVPSAPQVVQQRGVPALPGVLPKPVPDPQVTKAPETPAREGAQKFAPGRSKAGSTQQPLLDNKVREASEHQTRPADKRNEANSGEAVPKEQAPEETLTAAIPPESAVVVKKMTNDRVITNYNDAIRAAEQGNTEEAKKLYLTVLADRPNDIEALNNLGVLAMREDDTKEATFYFRRILEYRKDYPKAYNNLGILAMRNGEKGIAEEYLRKAVEVAPDDTEPYLNLAALLRSEQRLEEANRVVDTPLRRGRQGAQLYLSAALIKDELGLHEDAIKYYRHYLQASSSREERRKVIERLSVLEESQPASGH